MRRANPVGIIVCCAVLLLAGHTYAAEFSQAYKQVAPAVVTISAGERAGTGFLFAPDGYLLTNRHVVETDAGDIPQEEGAISVKLQTEEVAPAAVTHVSDDDDLCVLKIEMTNLPVVQFASSDKLTAGQDVAVIGAPLGLEHSITRGVISALDREIEGRSYLQLDAALNEGNSGGPVINEDGHVVGVAVKIAAEGQRLGFAIPSVTAMQFLQAEGLSFSAVLGHAPEPPPIPDEPAPPAVEPDVAPDEPVEPAPAAPVQMPASWLLWPILTSFFVALLTSMIIGLIFSRRAPSQTAAGPGTAADTQTPPQQPQQPQQVQPRQDEDLSDIDIDLH